MLSVVRRSRSLLRPISEATTHSGFRNADSKIISPSMMMMIPGRHRFMSESSAPASEIRVPDSKGLPADVLRESLKIYKDPVVWSHFTTDIAAARAANLTVNQIMKCGKKGVAMKILNSTMVRIRDKTDKDPLAVLQQAIHEVTPCVRIKSRRVGGTTYKVPNEIKSKSAYNVAIRWIVGAARKRKGRTMDAKLCDELIEAAKGTGEAVRKKNEVHKIAVTNRAFSHFR